MLTDFTAGLEEVAAAIGKEPEWLRRHWLSYHRRTGFPRKLPDSWRWPRRPVELWLRSAGHGRPLAEPVEAANQNGVEPVDPVALAAANLLDRYGANR